MSVLDTEGFITKVRNLIADNTTLALTDVYSPELPQEKDNIVTVTLLSGTQDYNLCGNGYFYPIFRTLVRGSVNDTTTRALCDDVYNSLNLQSNISFNSSTIIQILATTIPTYVGKDESLRNLYNITFQAKVK